MSSIGAAAVPGVKGSLPPPSRSPPRGGTPCRRRRYAHMLPRVIGGISTRPPLRPWRGRLRAWMCAGACAGLLAAAVLPGLLAPGSALAGSSSRDRAATRTFLLGAYEFDRAIVANLPASNAALTACQAGRPGPPGGLLGASDPPRLRRSRLVGGQRIPDAIARHTRLPGATPAVARHARLQSCIASPSRRRRYSRTPSGLRRLRGSAIPASLYSGDELFYGAFTQLPSELVVRSRGGRTALSQRLGRPGGGPSEVETCEGGGSGGVSLRESSSSGSSSSAVGNAR
jgi:hypothetical protein